MAAFLAHVWHLLKKPSRIKGKTSSSSCRWPKQTVFHPLSLPLLQNVEEKRGCDSDQAQQSDGHQSCCLQCDSGAVCTALLWADGGIHACNLQLWTWHLSYTFKKYSQSFQFYHLGTTTCLLLQRVLCLRDSAVLREKHVFQNAADPLFQVKCCHSLCNKSVHNHPYYLLFVDASEAREHLFNGWTSAASHPVCFFVKTKHWLTQISSFRKETPFSCKSSINTRRVFIHVRCKSVVKSSSSLRLAR